VTHARPGARTVLENWLASIAQRYDELNSAVSMLRGAVVAGYEDGTPEQVEIRKRALEVADWVTKISAAMARIGEKIARVPKASGGDRKSKVPRVEHLKSSREAHRHPSRQPLQISEARVG
jgi:hypothetical protein